MKLHCTYSGIVWNAEGFPSIDKMRAWQLPHPIFSLPLHSLLSRTTDFFGGKLSAVERRLLFLALLNSSKMVEWRTIAIPSDSLISQMFEKLVKTIGWLDLYEYYPALGRRIGPAFPRFVISSGTADLGNISHWLDAWADARGEYEAGQKREDIKEKQKRREAALIRLISNSGRDPQTYAKLLASWAADAAEFPMSEITGPAGNRISIREYWISLLTSTKIYEIPAADLAEIEDHLTENLDHGSSYATAVLQFVRRKRKAIASSLGLEDIFTEEQILALANSPFTIIPSRPDKLSIDDCTDDDIESSSTEQHNIRAGAMLAPEIEPKRQDFRTHTEFLRAKARWILAKTSRPAKSSI